MDHVKENFPIFSIFEGLENRLQKNFMKFHRDLVEIDFLGKNLNFMSNFPNTHGCKNDREHEKKKTTSYTYFVQRQT